MIYLLFKVTKNTNIHTIADSLENVSLKDSISNNTSEIEYSNLTENLEQVKHSVHRNRRREATAEVNGEVRVCIPTGEVGFSSLPLQLYRRISRQSLTFCLIIVAQSGLGKSTFINSMFRSDIYSREGISGVPLKNSHP